jgi:hypothetical protein
LISYIISIYFNYIHLSCSLGDIAKVLTDISNSEKQIVSLRKLLVVRTILLDAKEATKVENELKTLVNKMESSKKLLASYETTIYRMAESPGAVEREFKVGIENFE